MGRNVEGIWEVLRGIGRVVWVWESIEDLLKDLKGGLKPV
jgi:hypothetical protein